MALKIHDGQRIYARRSTDAAIDETIEPGLRILKNHGTCEGLTGASN
jgi:hypothetical protein